MPGVKNVTVHSVHSNTLRDAKNMNLLVQSTRACLKNKNCTKRMFYFPFS